LGKAGATEIVDSIIADMTGRRGLRQAWDEIDSELQDEIRAKWIALAKSRLPAPGPTYEQCVEAITQHVDEWVNEIRAAAIGRDSLEALRALGIVLPPKPGTEEPKQ